MPTTCHLDMISSEGNMKDLYEPTVAIPKPHHGVTGSMLLKALQDWGLLLAFFFFLEPRRRALNYYAFLPIATASAREVMDLDLCNCQTKQALLQ